LYRTCDNRRRNKDIAEASSDSEKENEFEKEKLRLSEYNQIKTFNGIKEMIHKPERNIFKVKEKVLITQNDTWDEDEDFSDLYRSSMIPGEMYVSITTLTDDEEEK